MYVRVFFWTGRFAVFWPAQKAGLIGPFRPIDRQILASPNLANLFYWRCKQGTFGGIHPASLIMGFFLGRRSLMSHKKVRETSFSGASVDHES
jgi:hypothetical protein